MLLWFVLALLTGAAVMAVLWPLTRRSYGVSDRANDVAVYRDQLGEIERDRNRGLIAETEANAARLEVSRRLLDADAMARAEPVIAAEAGHGRRRAAAILALIAVPALSLGLYWRQGSPDLVDQPRSARMEVAPEKATIDELIARVEQALKRNPQDGEGWEVIAPAYVGLGRIEEAKAAYGNALRLLGSTADREANYAELVVVTANGVITEEAKAGFQRAVAKDPNHFKSLFYLGVAKEQDGDKAGAIAQWQAIVAKLPASSQQAAFINSRIEKAMGLPKAAASPTPAPGPTGEQVAAAQDMTPADREAMIRTMVQGLSERLASQGGSLDEWLRLVRAYSVLGEKEKLSTAIADARKALAAEPASLQAIDEVAKSLGAGG